MAVATLLLAACSQGANTSDAAPDARSQLIIFAAASLNTAFPHIAEDVFEPDNPGVDVTFSFEGSSSLAEKILAGAPADVPGSANVPPCRKRSAVRPPPSWPASPG